MRLLDFLFHRTISGLDGPYLTKYRLLNLGKKFVRIYIHQFHRSDEDEELHSHPWKWAFSIVLKGGYIEFREKPETDSASTLVTRTLRPGSFNFIRDIDYHRVDLLEGEAWTLFIAGPETNSWFFLDPKTRTYTPWRAFVARKGLPV